MNDTDNSKDFFKRDIPNKYIFIGCSLILIAAHHSKHLLELIAIGTGTANESVNNEGLIYVIASMLGTIAGAFIVTTVFWGLGYLLLKNDRKNSKEAFWHYYIIVTVLAVLAAFVVD